MASKSGERPKKPAMVAMVSAVSDVAVIVATCAEQTMTRIMLNIVRKIQPELRASPCRKDTNMLQMSVAA